MPPDPVIKRAFRLPPHISGKNTLTRQHFEKVFKDCRPFPEPDIELATADLIVPVVENNLGIGFVPEPFALDALAKEKYLKSK